MGDFNYEVETAFVQQIMGKNDFFDVIRICGHKKYHQINTYKRGKKRIDYALASWGLIGVIEDAYYEEFEDYTDHRALFVRMKWDTSQIPPNRRRVLHTKQFRLTLKYRKKFGISANSKKYQRDWKK